MRDTVSIPFREYTEDCEVEFGYTPPSRGSVDRYGQKNEPDEPEEYEIIGVFDPAGNEIEDVTDEERDAIIERLKDL